MWIAYYYGSLMVSVILLLVYIGRWNKQFDVCYAVIHAMIPVINLGYLLAAMSKTVEEAVLGNKVVYFGICFLIPALLMSVMSVCKINIGRMLVNVMFVMDMALFGLVLTNDHTHWYYKSVTIARKNGVSVMTKNYGSAHFLLFVMLVAYALMGVTISLYSVLKKKKQISEKVALLQLVCIFVFGGVYVLQRVSDFAVEWMPAGYVCVQIIYLFIAGKIYLYDIDYMFAQSHTRNVDAGFFSVDRRMHFLGSNHIAKLYFEELRNLEVDRKVQQDTSFLKEISDWVQEVDQRHGNVTKIVPRDERIYKITVGYLFDDTKIRGYQFIVEDDTQEQRYIHMLNNYNENLEIEVNKKTKSVRDMQDKLILGMADMVEDRDNSTGGHIKRTSHVIRILMDEIMKDGVIKLDNTFCEYMIKAAPMHDLGKIAVDDVILRKPGRFTDEEYEIMKSHAEKGAEIVHRILDGIEDPYFAKIAENVAHYHHERYDGTGYPDRLKGAQIPIEARIMAIADVYDALVSKRCYKDSMSFDDAFRIIEDGMGKDFDPMFNIYFIRCRRKLEEYYRNVQSGSVG